MVVPDSLRKLPQNNILRLLLENTKISLHHIKMHFIYMNNGVIFNCCSLCLLYEINKLTFSKY